MSLLPSLSIYHLNSCLSPRTTGGIKRGLGVLSRTPAEISYPTHILCQVKQYSFLQVFIYSRWEVCACVIKIYYRSIRCSIRRIHFARSCVRMIVLSLTALFCLVFEALKRVICSIFSNDCYFLLLLSL